MKQDNIWTMNLDRYQRPRLNIPLSRLEVLQDVLSLAGIAVSFVALFFGPPGMPVAPLLIILFGSVFIYGLTTYARRFPNLNNYVVKITAENAEYQYRQARVLIGWFKTDTVWLLVGVQLLIELNTSILYVIAWSTLVMVLMGITIVYDVVKSSRRK